MLITKTVDLTQLADELRAAGVNVPALGTVAGEDGGVDLHTYSAEGEIADLPEGAATIVAAHVPVERPAPPTIEERLAAAEGALLALMGV
jgi:predicted nucleotidyltransferase